jgi:hypothetical protein
MTVPQPAEDDEQRCPRTDLLPSMCGHCRGHTDPSPMEDVAIVARWTARYPGDCGRCGEKFAPGDKLGRDEDGALVCWRCLP